MQSPSDTHRVRRAGPAFKWPGDAKVAVIFNIAYEGWTDLRAPDGASSDHFGVVRGIDRLLRIAARNNIATSVMTSGVVAERWPKTIRRIAGAGHELVAHAYAMEIAPAALDEAAERADIARTTKLIEAECGMRPIGWISPHATNSPRTLRLLADAGYQWHGDTNDDDLPSLVAVGGNPQRTLVAIPTGTEFDDVTHCLHHGNDPATLVDRFKTTLDRATAADAQPFMLAVTAHAHVFGRPTGAWVFDAMMQLAIARRDLWITTRHEMAAYVRENATHFG